MVTAIGFFLPTTKCCWIMISTLGRNFGREMPHNDGLPTIQAEPREGHCRQLCHRGLLFGPHNFPPNRALVEMHPILYSQVLQDDQPSGLTPQRAERSFPRYLEATSPHQRILHRFRSLFPTQFGCFSAIKTRH